MVKLPMLGFHLWLPKAHVEAPVLGSMILAGILLKLGGYGIFRFFPILIVLNYSLRIFICIFFYIGLLGRVVMSLICLRQVDLKILIAYSSVVHISVIILGLVRFSVRGLNGSFLIIVAHGFISPLLFYLIRFLYENLHSRSIIVLKGVILSAPLYCLF
jgi:NADH-ubiquinone oxidoreductase chain 4